MQVTTASPSSALSAHLARAILSDYKGSGHPAFLLTLTFLTSCNLSLLSVSANPAREPLPRAICQPFTSPSSPQFLTVPSCPASPLRRPRSWTPASSPGWKVATAKKRATLLRGASGLRVTSHPPNVQSGSSAGRRAQLPGSASHRLQRASARVAQRRARHGLSGDRPAPAAGPAAP